MKSVTMGFSKLSKEDLRVFAEALLNLGNLFVGGMVLSQLFLDKFGWMIAVFGCGLLSLMYMISFFILRTSGKE